MPFDLKSYIFEGRIFEQPEFPNQKLKNIEVTYIEGRDRLYSIKFYDNDSTSGGGYFWGPRLDEANSYLKQVLELESQISPNNPQGDDSPMWSKLSKELKSKGINIYHSEIDVS